MTAHPNRNWRRRAIDAYQRWRETAHGEVLREVPVRVGGSIEERLKGAYVAGYNDGRNDAKSRAPEHQLRIDTAGHK